MVAGTDTAPVRRRKGAWQDSYKAKALIRVAQVGVTRASADLGIPYRTLQDWQAGKSGSPPLEAIEEARQQAIADWEDLRQYSLADAKLDGKRGTAQFSDLVRAAAIAQDKLLLLRGEPTSISQSAPAPFDLAKLTREQKIAILKQLLTDVGMLQVAPPTLASGQATEPEQDSTDAHAYTREGEQVEPDASASTPQGGCVEGI